MNHKIFREYDIRGVADRDLSDELVDKLGKALATHLRPEGAAPTIVVGRDCRLTSPRLFEALTAGMRACGATVIDIGVVPTPLLYFAAHELESDGAVIITGSHNPSPDNGFKMLRGRSSIFGDEIQELKRRILEQDFELADSMGELRRDDLSESYLAYVTSTLKLGERRPSLVVDAGNGTGGPIALALYRRLGFNPIPVHCEMDGNFPNHHPDPTIEANLQDLKDAVSEHGAELGIALDGDSDRIGVVDSRGRVLWGDQLLILYSRTLLDEVPGASIIGEVKCSQALYDEVAKLGGNPIMSKVGHSLIKSKLKSSGSLLAGEMSGHIFFVHRFLGFDDGVYAGARLLEILSNTEQSLDELYDTLPAMVNTPEIRVECPDEIKFKVVDRVRDGLRAREDVLELIDIDGARALFESGWGLVRASNTQPSLVLRCEASSEDSLAQIRNIIESEIDKARATL